MNHQSLSAFIWSVADLLRGDYKQSEYWHVTLPFTLLRRPDCVLAPTKQAVLDAAGKNLPVPMLTRAAGNTFFNRSPLDLVKLIGDHTSSRSESNYMKLSIILAGAAHTLAPPAVAAQDDVAAQALEVGEKANALAEQLDDDHTLKADPLYRYTNLAKAKAQRIADIDAAMRLMLTDTSLGERLPLPNYVLYAELRTMMAYDWAWTDRSRQERLETPLIRLSEQSGTLSYHEWACQTGRENEVMAKLGETLQWALTAYPRRALEKLAIDKRQALGFGKDRICSPSALEKERQSLSLEYSMSWWSPND